MNTRIMRVNPLLVVLLTSLLISGLFLTLACSSGNKTTTTVPSSSSASGVNFTKDVQPIFNSNCVVCHQGTASGYAGLSLEPAQSYKMLVGVKSLESEQLRVKAGTPDQSYLIAKLQGTQTQAGGSGARMPYGGAPLQQAQISLIQQWITQGAPNN